MEIFIEEQTILLVVVIIAVVLIIKYVLFFILRYKQIKNSQELLKKIESYDTERETTAGNGDEIQL